MLRRLCIQGCAAAPHLLQQVRVTHPVSAGSKARWWQGAAARARSVGKPAVRWGAATHTIVLTFVSRVLITVSLTAAEYELTCLSAAGKVPGFFDKHHVPAHLVEGIRLAVSATCAC